MSIVRLAQLLAYLTGRPIPSPVVQPAGIAHVLPRVYAGAGTPEAIVTAPIGTLYVNVSGGAATTLYVKTSGAGNTGWTAK